MVLIANHGGFGILLGTRGSAVPSSLEISVWIDTNRAQDSASNDQVAAFRRDGYLITLVGTAERPSGEVLPTMHVAMRRSLNSSRSVHQVFDAIRHFLHDPQHRGDELPVDIHLSLVLG